MRNLLLATMLTMLPLAASAQDPGTAEMEQGLSMLELGASRALSSLGIEADVMSLTLNQLAEIKEVVDGGRQFEHEGADRAGPPLARVNPGVPADLVGTHRTPSG